jgi:uncharacterized surface protein with fasciclin (FAS1) repeats
MKKIVSLLFITAIVSGPAVLAMKQTEAALMNALQRHGSQGKAPRVAKSVMAAINHRAELRSFVDVVHRVGLHYALRGYAGKQPKSKKTKRFLPMIAVGDKITVLAPQGSVMLPIVAKLRSAQVMGDKAERAAVMQEATDLLTMHIIKGEVKRANLKGQLETIGGKKIDADQLVIHAGDIMAGNGVLHVIRALAVDAAAAPVAVPDESVEADPSAAPSDAKVVVPVIAAIPGAVAGGKIAQTSPVVPVVAAKPAAAPVVVTAPAPAPVASAPVVAATAAPVVAAPLISNKRAKDLADGTSGYAG